MPKEEKIHLNNRELFLDWFHGCKWSILEKKFCWYFYFVKTAHTNCKFNVITTKGWKQTLQSCFGEFDLFSLCDTTQNHKKREGRATLLFIQESSLSGRHCAPHKPLFWVLLGISVSQVNPFCLSIHVLPHFIKVNNVPEKETYFKNDSVSFELSDKDENVKRNLQKRKKMAFHYLNLQLIRSPQRCNYALKSRQRMRRLCWRFSFWKLAVDSAFSDNVTMFFASVHVPLMFLLREHIT